jgi:hypothetical protein
MGRYNGKIFFSNDFVKPQNPELRDAEIQKILPHLISKDFFGR